MSAVQFVQMTNMEKAATMLVCLGVEKAAQVFALLSYEEVQMLATQMTHVGRITEGMRREALSHLRQRSHSPELLMTTSGGMDFVHRLLAQTFGNDRASTILEQLTQRRTARPFSVLKTVEPRRILDIISAEHPSVIALVLYYLPRDKAASILSGLVEKVRHEVVMRLVNLQTPNPQMVSRLEELLAEKLADTMVGGEDQDRDFGNVSGPRTLVEILGRVDPAVEKTIYSFLQEHDPELAEEVHKSMFVFEDIFRLDQRSLQLVLREMSSQELALSLKGTSDEMKATIFGNVSENSARTIREELELLGPVRMSQVEEARQKAVTTVRALVEAGTINLNQADQEELVD